MRLLIVGCGAVAGYFGPRLSAAGHDVAYLVRSRTAELLRRRQLELRWPDRTEHLPVHVITVAELGAWTAAQRPDAIWLTVKCYDLAGALDDLQALGVPLPPLVTCQNGLGAEELILQRYPSALLIGGIAYVSAERIGAGIIECQPGGWAAFGPWAPMSTEAARRWLAAWERAGCKTRFSDNVRRAKWEKLAWNAVFNALTAGLRCSLGEVLDAPTWRKIGREAVEEIRRVARRQGLALDERLIETFFRTTETFRQQHTSMYMDLVAGRPTEIEWINGAVVRLGAAAGIPTPVNRALVTLVKMQEALRSSSVAAAAPHAPGR